MGALAMAAGAGEPDRTCMARIRLLLATREAESGEAETEKCN